MTMKRGMGIAIAFVAVSLAATACTAPAPPDPNVTSASKAGAECPKDALCKVGEVVKPKDGKRYKIGAAFPVLDQFLQNVADGMRSRAKEAGVDLNIVSANSRADVQVNQVQDFIAKKMDAIIVLPQTTDATGPITKAAQDAKIPLVYVNRRPSSLPEGVPYVGSNERFAGELEGKEIGRLLNNKGNVVILQGDPAQESARLRTEGCKAIVEGLGMKVIDTQAGLWHRNQGLSITETWLQSGKNINAICSNNDDMALGAIQALENAGKLKDIKVTGVDAIKDGLASMKAGKLAFTVFQDAKSQGSGGIDAAVTLANKGKVAAFIDIPFQPVTPENMDKFANK